MKFLLLVVCLFCLGCSGNPEEPKVEKPWFSEEAKTRGIDFVFESGFNAFPYNPEIISGGVALLDVDGDSDIDIYFVQGGSVVNKGQTEFANQLFLNDGKGFFFK